MIVRNKTIVVAEMSEQEAKAMYKELDNIEFSDEENPVVYDFYKELEDVV